MILVKKKTLTYFLEIASVREGENFLEEFGVDLKHKSLANKGKSTKDMRKLMRNMFSCKFSIF